MSLTTLRRHRAPSRAADPGRVLPPGRLEAFRDGYLVSFAFIGGMLSQAGATGLGVFLPMLAVP